MPHDAMKILRIAAVPCLLLVAPALVVTAGGGCGAPGSQEIHLAPPPEPVAVVVPVETAAPTATAEAEPACVDPPGPRPEIVNLADGGSWPAPTPIPLPKNMGAAVEKACKKIEARKAPAMKKAEGVGDTEMLYVGTCLPSAKGAWAIDIDKAEKLLPDKDHDDEGWKVHYTLSYVTPEGKVVRSLAGSGEIGFRTTEQQNVDVLLIYDYDGDGASELLLMESSHYGGEEHNYHRTLYTFKDGEILQYEPTKKLDIRDVVDADRDGRPDLVTPGPFIVTGPCGLDGHDYRGPLQLAHSLPDGTFSQDDAAAKEAVRVPCGPMQRELVSMTRARSGTSVDPDDTAKRITCARIYGMTDREAAQRVRARYPFPHKKDDTEPEDSSSSGYCMPLKLMVELAGQKPDFTTEAPCAPR